MFVILSFAIELIFDGTIHVILEIVTHAWALKLEWCDFNSLVSPMVILNILNIKITLDV